MLDCQTSTRRHALGIAALTVSMIVIGEDAATASPSESGTESKSAGRPTREEMARAARLYAGEFGGGVGVR